MRVRLRITVLFASIVLFILIIAGGSVYFFSYQNRISNISTRLKNRAITTARLLTNAALFNRSLVQKIDSSTTVAFINKSIQAYDSNLAGIYTYSDLAGDTIPISKEILKNALASNSVYFTSGEKDVITCHVTNNNTSVVVIAAAIDIDGKKKLLELRLIIFFSFAGGLLIAVAGGYFFSGGLLRPIRRIADEVNEISAKNLASRINQGNADDEWSYLSSTLNQLLNRLQDSFEVQQRFIAHASHELSTPLTSISSQLEVSMLKEREAGDYRKVMESVYQDVRHLNKLTQTLLEFASASGSSAGLEINVIRIDEILLSLPAALIKIDSRYTARLDFEHLPPDENRLLIWGNAELLFSAINNIVSNACKYSPDHKAEVRLMVGLAEIVIIVTDNGPGIAAAEMTNIFQPFYRVNTNKEIAGFGLGLSLANRIIKLHKGRIQVESGEQTGAVFTIILPVAGKVSPPYSKHPPL